MSDVDPTPSTPVTVGDRLGWFRGDVAAQLAALQAQLVTLQGTPAADLAQLQAAVAALQGTPAANFASVISAITALRGLSNTNLGQLLSEDGFVNGMIQLQSKLLDIENRIDKIQAVLGAEPYSSTETANLRAIMLSIMNALSAQINGLPPTLGNGDISTGNWELVSGRRYATWLTPISGITIAANKYDLTATGGWSGWQAYVQTNAPVIYVGSATDVPNAWLQLVGNGTINFSVDSAYNIRAYLRPIASGNCQIFSSIFTVNSNRAQFFSAAPHFTLSPVNWSLQGNYSTYTIQSLQASSTINVAVGPNYNSTPTANFNLAIGETRTVVINSVYLWTSASAPFQIRMCPPT